MKLSSVPGVVVERALSKSADQRSVTRLPGLTIGSYELAVDEPDGSGFVGDPREPDRVPRTAQVVGDVDLHRQALAHADLRISR